VRPARLTAAVDAPREDRLEQLFEEASALPLERRAAFLRGACGADADLRHTLEALLADADDAHGFIDRVATPAVARAAGNVLDDTRPTVGDPGDALVGQRVGHFHIVEKLGGGGMGRVYKARDLRLDRVVALKLLPPHLSADDEAKRRFVHEAKAASALAHPNLCTIHEIGETDAGQLFIAMAFYDGETLKRLIARGPLPVAAAVDWVAQLADALRHAHAAGIVHRDVKPANVMVTDAGGVKLLDFGVAKVAGTELTRAGATIGTVAYMSPEQTRGDPVDARTDLWSLGALLYEALTGRRPFRCESEETLIYAIRHDEPPPVRRLRAEIPAGVAAIVGRCLEKDPRRRYQGADELLTELRAVGMGGAVRRARWPRRALRLAGTAGALCVLLVAVRAGPTRPEARFDSLAVLPVTVRTGGGAAPGAAQGAAHEDLASGMTDLLITQLSQLGGLRRVISRTAVMPYAGTRKSSRQIGRELGVDALVETSVLRDGERVRVDVGLIDAAAGRVLWSRSFERPTRDALTLQREVAQAIARELHVRLTPGEAARLAAAAREVDPEALALYLQAVREGDGRRQLVYLEQAIAKDSAFALAHARIAGVYVMIAHDRGKAERAIARALALDPALSEGYDALGLLRMWVDWDWPAAEAALRRSIALNPHNSHAHHELGQLLVRLKRCDEAVAEARRAVLESPGVEHFQSGLGEVYHYCRRYEDAVREFGRTLGLARDSARTFTNLGEAYFHAGAHARALAMYRASGRVVPGWAHVPLGSRREARAQIDSLEAAWAGGAGPRFLPFVLARLHASLGEREQALAWLERTYDAREGLVVYLAVDPHFDPLRGEPRFRALLQRVGLPH
jgi:eukaryotic-like serine/threonine-protein kinase